MKTAFTLTLAVVFVAGAAMAQPEERPMKRIEQFKKIKLLEVLDLNESAANAFLVKYDRWQKDIMQLSEDRKDLAMRMKLATEMKTGEQELNGILDSMVSVSKRLDDTKYAMFSDLRTILTPKQAVKLAFFEIQWQRKLHDSLDKLREHGHSPWKGD